MQSTLPNALTVSRILATPVVCLLLYFENAATAWLALVVYVCACFTDFLDGFLARAWRQQSSFGRFLDPVADKLLVGLVLLVLVGIDRLPGVHILPAAVILWREILVSSLRDYLAQLNVPLPVTRLAKSKTTLQMIAMGFLVVGDFAPAIGPLTAIEVGQFGLWAAAILTFITGYDYLRAGLVHLGIAGFGRRRSLRSADPARDAG
jgi:cardiolipin synthase